MCPIKLSPFWLLKYAVEIQELFQVKEDLRKSLGREPTESEVAEATNMSVVQVKRHLEVGRAARNKLIKVKIMSYMCFFLLNALEFLLILLCLKNLWHFS